MSFSTRASERTSTGSSSGSACVQVLGAADARGAGAQARERADGERRGARRGERGDRKRGEPDQRHEQAQAVGAGLTGARLFSRRRRPLPARRDRRAPGRRRAAS